MARDGDRQRIIKKTPAHAHGALILLIPFTINSLFPDSLFAGLVMVVHETLQQLLDEAVRPFVETFDQFIALHVEAIDVVALRNRRRGRRRRRIRRRSDVKIE